MASLDALAAEFDSAKEAFELPESLLRDAVTPESENLRNLFWKSFIMTTLFCKFCLLIPIFVLGVVALVAIAVYGLWNGILTEVRKRFGDWPKPPWCDAGDEEEPGPDAPKQA